MSEKKYKPDCPCWEWREWEEYPAGATIGAENWSGYLKVDDDSTMWEDWWKHCPECGKPAREEGG